LRVPPLACALLIAAVACDGGNVVPSGASLGGTWTLRAINHAALPYALPQSPNGYPTTILGAILTISGSDSGSYLDVIAARVVTPMRTIDTSLTYSGTWVFSGGSITFNDNIVGDVYQASVVNDTIVKPVLFGYYGEYSRWPLNARPEVRPPPDGRLLSYSLTRDFSSELHVVTPDRTDSRMLPGSRTFDYLAVWRP